MHSDPLSSLNFIGLAFTLPLGVSLVALPRRVALLPIILITCYMTFGQRLVIAGLDFTMVRLIVLFACARAILRREDRSIKWLRNDSAVFIWVLCSVVAYTLLWQTPGALVNRLGFAYNALGLYFTFRMLIQNSDDIVRACRYFAIVMVPLAVCMCIEQATGRNPFVVFGGVPEATLIRGDVTRCQGPFRHPILAGTFGAVWLPLFVGLWWQGRKHRFIAGLGIISSAVIAVLSGSSGPVGTLLAGAAAVAAWPIRRHMRTIRWSAALLLLALHAAMQAPVWYLLARVNLRSGSTGWHRAYLIDRTVAHFGEWALIGAKDVAAWGVWAGDITNQYILEAVNGGLLALLAFLSIIALVFSSLGKALRAAESECVRSARLLWAIGSAVFAHAVTFLSVSYFDQNIVNWYMSLAMAAAAFSVYLRRPRQSRSLA